MSSHGLPCQQARVYCCSDTLSFSLKGKLAACGRFLFSICICDLLQEQVICLVIMRRTQVGSQSTKPNISLMKLKIGSSTRPDASRVK